MLGHRGFQGEGTVAGKKTWYHKTRWPATFAVGEGGTGWALAYIDLPFAILDNSITQAPF